MPKDGKVIVSGVNVADPPPQAEPGQPAGWPRALAKRRCTSRRSRIATADGKPTRVRFETQDGKKVRVAVKTGETIDG